MGINIIFLLIMLQILKRFGNARPVPVQPPPPPVQIERSNFTKTGSKDATPLSGTVENYSIRHIPREKRALPMSTTDIDIIHDPCELDIRTNDFEVNSVRLKNHCRYAYNARFDTEADYKNYRLFQMEAFTFGQHHERYRRFESEPHTFEYRSTGLLS